MTQRSRTYVAWIDMRQRCRNPNNASYQWYGGRGIQVCERWESFENFLTDMGEVPDGMSIEREDNDGNYEPGNCRWATNAEQQRNRRNVQLLTWRDETLCTRDWSRRLGLNEVTISSRLRRGWSVDRALSEPVQ